MWPNGWALTKKGRNSYFNGISAFTTDLFGCKDLWVVNRYQSKALSVTKRGQKLIYLGTKLRTNILRFLHEIRIKNQAFGC